MSDLEKSASDLLDVLTSTIEKTVNTTTELSQPALETTVEMMFLQSLFTIIGGSIAACLVVVCLGGFFFLMKKAEKAEDAEAYYPGMMLIGIVTIPLAIITGVTLFSKTAWVGMVSPEARLAMELLEKF